MKVCIVVLNPIWCDPRVRKQISSYKQSTAEIFCVGIKDNRFNAEEVHKLEVPVELIEIEKKYFREGRTIFTKIKREIIKFKRLMNGIAKINADIIHANDLNALVPAYFACKKNKKGILIYDSHEIFLENNMLQGRKMLRFIYSILERYIIKRVDLVVTVSNAAADYLVKKYGILRPTVITNTVNPVDNTMLPIQKTGVFEVLNHGQFYAGRGYEIMAHSGKYLKDYPEIQLVLRGYGKLKEKIESISREENNDNFRIDPPVKVHELIPMAAHSHVGVAITEPICLNFELSISNKLFEYAAAGLPVIMSDIPEHRYLNNIYHFGVILEDNKAETFAKAVLKFYEDRDFYNKCRQNALKMITEKNWDREFKSLYDIECSLLGSEF